MTFVVQLNKPVEMRLGRLDEHLPEGQARNDCRKFATPHNPTRIITPFVRRCTIRRSKISDLPQI